MALDLSKLSDADLTALETNDFSKMSDAGLALLESSSAKQQQKETKGRLDFLPKGVPDWMQSKPGQGWDDVNAPVAGGDVTNPMAYLSEAQKTEQGAVGKTAGQVVNRLVQQGAGVAKGAVINPVSALAQVVGGEEGRQFAEQAQKSYSTQRQNAGEGSFGMGRGFDLAELVGGVVSPVNKFIPGIGAPGTVLGRGAAQGVIGAVLNPVTGENLSLGDIVAGKIEQAGAGALFGRLAGGIAGALTPTLKTGAKELMEAGVPVTPGQGYDGAWGGLFRRIEKLDIPGMRANKEAINKGFTTSIGNEVLSSIDDKLPANIQNGQQAFGYIQNKISNYYDDALEKIGTVKVDNELQTGLKDAIVGVKSKLGNKQGKEVENFINANITNRLKNGELDGTDLKRIETIFRKRLDKISTSKAMDTPADVLKTGYDDAYKAIKGFILRNDADGSIAKANEAYMKRARFLEAVNKNAAEVMGSRGNFSPAELAQIAGKQGTPTQMAQGTAPLQDLANRALDVVGDTSQQGANFRDIMVAGKLTGLGALGLFKPVYAIPILTAAGMPYLAAKQLMKDPGATRLAVQKAIQENPGLVGNIVSQKGLFGAGKK